MSELTLTRTAYIKAPAAEVWRALTDPQLTVQYVGGRVQSTWRPGDEVAYLAPDSDEKLLLGRLLEVEPNRRLVLECRWLFTPELAADKPHREVFELEPMGEITRLTATFDGYEPGSPAYLACDMARTGENLKSVLETGAPLFS
jgi:uncharacterized protein YndB with AHSA1/START domain